MWYTKFNNSEGTGQVWGLYPRKNAQTLDEEWSEGRGPRSTHYQPGEYLVTDLQGPYSRTRVGNRYNHLVYDLGSKYLWTFRIKKKPEALANLDLVLNEVQTFTGQKVKFLRTDGDGIFRQSKNFLDLQKKYGFRHERPGPYDHKHSAHIDRECSEMARELYFESGLPSSFWGEASNHFTFVKIKFQSTG